MDNFEAGLVRRRNSFIADQRGAAAFETLIVWPFMMMLLLLPLADMAIAGFRFVSAWEALRSFGQYLQDHKPDDVTDTSAWMISVLAKADPDFPIDKTNFKLGCVNATLPCTTNSDSPKYYSYTTTVTLSPMVLGTAPMNAFKCPDKPTPCTFTLSYSQQFQ